MVAHVARPARGVMQFALLLAAADASTLSSLRGGADKYIAAFKQLRASLADELEGSGVGALQVVAAVNTPTSPAAVLRNAPSPSRQLKGW